MSKKVVDLVISEDGSYSPKRETNRQSPNHRGKTGLIHTPKDEKPKYLLGHDADEFLAGLDVGLDLVDAVSIRVNRFLKLRV